MAATASPQMPMTNNPDFGPDMGRRRSSIVHMGAYRVIRRNSQMLSESGPLLSPGNPSGTPASPLLQIASDLNNSLLAVRRDSLTRRYSTELQDTPLSDKSIKSGASSPRRGVSPDMTRHRTENLSHSKSFSYPSTGSESDRKSKLSNQDYPGGRLANTLTSPRPGNSIAPSLNLTDTKPQSFLYPNLRAERDKRGSYSEASTGKPDEDLQFSRENSKLEPRSEDGRHGNTRRGSHLFTQSPRSPTVSQLERKRLSVEFTALREQGRQLLTDSKSPSSPHDTKLPTHDRVPSAHMSITDPEKSEDATVHETSDNSVSSEPKAKSKFLSSLYNGHEKIQNFINKGRSQIKAQELNARLNINRQNGSLFDGPEVKSSLLIADYRVDGGVTEKGVDEREGNNSSSESSRQTSDLNPGSLITPESIPKTVDLGSSYRDLDLTPVRGGTVTGGGQLSTDRFASKTLRASDVISSTHNSANNRSLRHDESGASHSRFSNDLESPVRVSTASPDARFSNSFDDNNEVFLSPGLAPGALRTTAGAAWTNRRFTSFDVFDFSTSHKRSPSISPGSSVSSSRSSTPVPGAPAAKTPRPRLGSDQDRRRFSLPDADMEAREKIKTALKTASRIKEKYTTGSYSPNGRRSSLKGQSPSDQRLESEKPQRPVPKPRMSLSTADARKSRDISLRSNLASATKERDSRPTTSPPKPAKRTSPGIKSAPPKHEQSYSTDLARQSARQLELAPDSSRMEAMPMNAVEYPKSTVRRASSDVKDYLLSNRRSSSAAVMSSVQSRPPPTKDKATTSGHGIADQTTLINTADVPERETMGESRRHQQRRESERGSGLTAAAALGRRASYSPVISGHSDSGASTRAPAGRSGSFSVRDAATVSLSYKGITNLIELQKLLSQTSDSVERNNIRKVIRLLRHLPDYEQLKKAKAGSLQLTAQGFKPQKSSTVDRPDVVISAARTQPTKAPGQGDIVPRRSSTASDVIISTNQQNHDKGFTKRSAHSVAPNTDDSDVTSKSTPDVTQRFHGTSNRTPPKSDQTLINNQNISPDKDGLAKVEPNLIADSLHTNYFNTTKDVEVTKDVEGKKDELTTNAPITKDESANVLDFVRSRLYSRSSNAERKTPDNLTSPAKGAAQLSVTDAKTPRRGSTGGERYRQERQQILAGLAPRLSLTPETSAALIKSSITPLLPSSFEASEKLGHTRVANDATFPTHPRESVKTKQHSISADIVQQGNQQVVGETESLHQFEDGGATDSQREGQTRQDFIFSDINSALNKPTTPVTNHKIDNVSNDREKRLDDLTDLKTSESIKKSPEALVSSLALGSADPGHAGSTIRRTQSLNAPIARDLPGGMLKPSNGRMSHDYAMKHETSEMGAQDVTDHWSDSKTHSSLEITSGVSRPPERMYDTLNSDHSTLKMPSTFQGVSETFPSSMSSDTDVTAETLELPTKSTLTRSRPVGRSLTESRLTRPDRYRGQTDAHSLAIIDEQSELGREEPPKDGSDKVEPQLEEPLRGSRQRKVGVIMSGAPVVKLETEFNSIPIQNDYGLGPATSENTFDHLKDLLGDIDSRKPVDGEALAVRMKRFSAPVRTYTHPQVMAAVDDSTGGSQPKRRHSEIYNKQEAVKMEQAFNSLLEDLDKVSTSEGNVSDIDLSDGEDLLALSSSSSASNDSNRHAGPPPVPDHQELIPVERQVKENSVSPPHLDTTDSIDFEKIQTTVDAELFSLDTFLDNELDNDLDNRNEVIHTASTFRDTFSKDSGDDPGVDGVSHPVGKDDVDGRGPLSSPVPSTPPPLVTTPSKPKGGPLPVSGGIIMTGERVGGDIDTDHATDTDAPEVLRDAKILTSTTTLQLAPSPQISAPRQVGARTFHVNTAQDGSVTVQASAKDENQNRIVTVRTKKQRTSSNANEELRDKIVQRRLVTPGGTVVEEKGVVQTKKRLTSRGSNYYTRKTYTTRTKRDKEGVETVEHDVTVETENKSVSQGQSWGDKVVTQVTLGDETVVNGSPTLTSGLADSRGLEKADVEDSLSDVTKDAASVAKETGLTDVTSKQTKMAVQKPKDPPEILYALRDVTSVEGKHVVLECSIKASQPSRVTWYKDNVELTHADLYAGHYDEVSGKATLTIPDATIFDTADYSCLCRNEDGEARTRANVVIKRRYETPPTFTKGLSDVAVTEGHSIVLTCTVVGAASASWMKDGSEVKESPEVKQSFDGGEASLEIFDVFLDDAGQYECVVRNDCGDSSSSCTLSVLASSSDTTVVPMFLTKLSNTQVFNGETLSLECDVIGSPEPNTFWLKDGKDLSTDLSFSANYDGRVSSLQISNMRPEDAGHYKCVAENSAGKVSVEAHVTVQVKRAPHFVSKLQDASVTPGKGVVLRCEIMGSPQPSVAWMKDGTPVGRSSQRYIQSYNNGVARLEVLRAEAEDGGRYECTIKNLVAEISCSCTVRVEEVQAPKAIEAFAPKTEQVVEQAPRVTRSRPLKKQSEPKPSDIITAVLHRATVTRTQSFGPSSTSMVDIRQNIAHPLTGNTSSSSLSGISGLSQIDLIMSPVSQRPETLVYQSASTSDLTTTGTSPKLDHSSLDHSKSERSFASVSTSELSKEQDSSLFTPSPRVTNLGRSVSMHVVRNNLSSPDSAGVKPSWATHGRDSRETISKAGSLEVITESKPLGPIPGYKSVSPVFLTSPEKEKLSAASPLARSDSSISHSHDNRSTVLTRDTGNTAISVDQKQAAVKTLSASLSSLTAHPTSKHDSPITKLTTPPSSVTTPTSSFTPPTELVNPPKFSSSSPSTSSAQSEESSEKSSQTIKAQLPRVSLLRQQFLQNDLLASSHKQKQVGGGVKRWHSLPPQETRPNVVKRDKTVLPPPSLTAMPSYDEINDEEELHKLMNSTEDFEERKKIRSRLREIRDKQREDYEAKRKQREAEVEDLVKKKFEKAEEEKKKKMDAYKQQAPTHERESKYQQISQNLIADKHKVSEDEKAKKLASYTHIAETTGPGGDKTVTKTTSSSSSEKTPGGGTRTTTTTTKVESSTKSFGGTSYGKPAAKPQGPQNAMAAFKQMDNATAPAGAKPKVSLARSPSAIKQVLLDWTKAMTRGYPGVEITNFSSSWNNGLAFCALIHHFFPDAFDFSTLDATKRRYNFTLAFDTAEKEADIAPLLDVDDMVKMKNPDWKCVFTYVQSIYRHLKDHANNKASSVEQ